MQRLASDKKAKASTVIAITSGKGGVGKTLTTVNFAVAARKLGLQVLILDGDLGLANVDVVLGIQTRYNVRDVLDGTVALRDIIVEGPMGIKVIPSGSGITSLTNLSYVQKQLLVDEVAKLNEHFDLVLIDTGAGISENVMHFNRSADHVVVVTTPEPHALTDAYAMIKVLSESCEKDKVWLLVNQTRSPDEGLKIHERIAEVAKRFLQIKIEFLGHVPSDPLVQRSVMQRRAASEHSTLTLAGQAWNQVARRAIAAIDAIRPAKEESISPEDMWKNLLWTSASPRFPAQVET